MREYEIESGGQKVTVQLDDEEANRRGLTAPQGKPVEEHAVRGKAETATAKRATRD